MEQELKNLVARALAVLEDPDCITPEERVELMEDMLAVLTET